MLKIGIIGATGYTGLELIRCLVSHPKVEITVLTSQSYQGRNISQVFPSLVGKINLMCRPLDIEDIARIADFIFIALPHQTAMDIVPQFLEKGKKVVDLSADFRLKKKRIYEKWYGKHSAPHLLQKAVYGLPELDRNKIKKARLVANPGCYPTSAILSLAPLLQKKLIDSNSIIVDAMSGVSGAGRSLDPGTQFVEVNENSKGYKVAEHRHTSEMEQELSILAGEEIFITFVPHLVPINRGILSTIYSNLTKEVSIEKLSSIYQDFYQGERFIRIYPIDTFPGMSGVRASNFCDIGIRIDSRTGRVVVISAIDNLVKGASGQAVQNMNIMEGFPEELGINAIPVFP